MTKKESLRKKHERLMEELVEMNDSLNEQQKEISIGNPPSADFHAILSLIEHKRKRTIELEKQLGWGE